MTWCRSMLSVLCLAMLAAGCGGGAAGDAPETYPVTGKVTMDGQPVPEGSMIFEDPAGKDRSFGAMIKDGEFSTEMTPGKKKVQITATRQSKDKTEPGPAGGDPVPATEQYIPAKYNEQTTLEAEITADGPNELKFELTSD